MKRFFLAHLLVLGFAFVCSAGTRPLEEDQAVTIIIGPLVDDTGAALTALNVANIDCNLYKNNGTKVDVQLEASGTSNDCVHVEDGYYSLELTATETSTPGYLRITFQISGALLFHEDFTVLPSNTYDSDIAGTDKRQVDVQRFGGASTALSIAAGRKSTSRTFPAIKVPLTTQRSCSQPTSPPTIIRPPTSGM
jgi:hypothetical protein